MIADRAYYACSTRVHGGPQNCSNDYRAKRVPIEAGNAYHPAPLSITIVPTALLWLREIR